MFNNFVFDAVEEGLQVDVIFTNFTKAFDGVDHSILMERLSTTGFGEPILSWLKSYMYDTLQWVKLYDNKSTVFLVNSGVP